MVSTIRYSANASSDHHPNQAPGILIIMNPKQPNLPTCSVTSTYLLFHLLSNPSLHLIANTTLGIIMTAIKNQPKNIKPFHIIYHHKFRFVSSIISHARRILQLANTAAMQTFHIAAVIFILAFSVCG